MSSQAQARIFAVVGAIGIMAALVALLSRPASERALALTPTPTPTATATPTPNAPGTWAPAPPYHMPLEFHKSVSLPDGSVLVAGGFGPGFTTREPAHFLPASHQWDTAGWETFSPGLADTLTVLADGRVLITNVASDLSHTFSQVYDPATKQWVSSGNLLVTRGVHTATLLADGTVLVVGGENIFGPVPQAEIFDPATSTWSFAPSPANTHVGHTATRLGDGSVLISASRASPAERYSGGVWSAAGASMPGRDRATATLLTDGRVLLVGGSTSANPETYDPATNSWSAAGSLVRQGHAAVRLADGRVLVAGGIVNGSGPPSSDAAVYDPATNEWTAVASMLMQRARHTANLLPDGRVLVVGGSSIQGPPGAGTTASTEYYNPQAGAGSTFTPTPTPSPTNTIGPTDTSTPYPTIDTDADGCYDWQEEGEDPFLGGMRNPSLVYDFYDINGTRKIDAVDVGNVRMRFNPSGPVPPEDTIFDRSPGVYPWAPNGPDGKINAADIGMVRASFNHNCNLP